MDEARSKFMPTVGQKVQWEQDTVIIQRLFSSPDGQYVLGLILEWCKFMEQCDNERDMALNNFAKELIARVYWDNNKQSINIHWIISFIRKKLKKEKS